MDITTRFKFHPSFYGIKKRLLICWFLFSLVTSIEICRVAALLIVLYIIIHQPSNNQNDEIIRETNLSGEEMNP